jgi:hypothetical protein
VGGVKCKGSSAVVTSGDPGNPTFLDSRHQYGPEYTTSLDVEMWVLLYLEISPYSVITML